MLNFCILHIDLTSRIFPHPFVVKNCKYLCGRKKVIYTLIKLNKWRNYSALSGIKTYISPKI